MREYEIKPNLKEILGKLAKKDKILFERIMSKIEEIINCEEIGHYKNLRYGLKEMKRVHIGHFVLVFSFTEEENKIAFLDFDHHDRIYSQ
jgi:YafQ family addiction module toxin component